MKFELFLSILAFHYATPKHVPRARLPLCAPESAPDVFPPTDEPTSCAAVTCLVGHDCVLLPGVCSQPPCPPTAHCIPSSGSGQYNTCGSQTCEPGYTCELVQVQCVTTPCPPLPQCVPMYSARSMRPRHRWARQTFRLNAKGCIQASYSKN